jgi:hypothetical protein
MVAEGGLGPADAKMLTIQRTGWNLLILHTMYFFRSSDHLSHEIGDQIFFWIAKKGTL